MIPPRWRRNGNSAALEIQRHFPHGLSSTRAGILQGLGLPSSPALGCDGTPEPERKIREKKLISFALGWIISCSSCPKTKHFCWLKQHESTANWIGKKKKKRVSGRFVFSSASTLTLIQEGKKIRKRVLQEILRACLWALPPSLNKQNIILIPHCFLWKGTGSPHSWFLSTCISKFFSPSRKWSRQQHQLDGRRKKVKKQKLNCFLSFLFLCELTPASVHSSSSPNPKP